MDESSDRSTRCMGLLPNFPELPDVFIPQESGQCQETAPHIPPTCPRIPVEEHPTRVSHRDQQGQVAAHRLFPSAVGVSTCGKTDTPGHTDLWSGKLCMAPSPADIKKEKIRITELDHLRKAAGHLQVLQPQLLIAEKALQTATDENDVLQRKILNVSDACDRLNQQLAALSKRNVELAEDSRNAKMEREKHLERERQWRREKGVLLAKQKTWHTTAPLQKTWHDRAPVNTHAQASTASWVTEEVVPKKLSTGARTFVSAGLKPKRAASSSDESSSTLSKKPRTTSSSDDDDATPTDEPESNGTETPQTEPQLREEMTEGQNNTLSVSNELLLKIFLKTNHMTIGVVAQVCKRWEKLVHHESISNFFGRDIAFTKYRKCLAEPQILCGHKDSVYALQVTKNGNLFSGGEDHTIRIWSKNGTEIRKFIAHDDTVYSLSFGAPHLTKQQKTVRYRNDGAEISDDEDTDSESEIIRGPQLYSASEDMSVRIWQEEDGSNNAASSSLSKQSSRPQSRASSPINRFARRGSHVPRLEGRAVCNGHTGWVYAVVTGSDGKVYSGSADKTIRVWSPKGEHLKTLTGHTSGIRSLAVAPNNILYSGSFDSEIRVWSPDGDAIRVMKGHTDSVRALVVGVDGRLFSGSWDKTIRMWSSDGELLKVMNAHTGGIRALAVTPEGRLISGSRDRTVRIWSHDGRLLHTLRGHTDWISAVAVAPDGRIFSGSRDCTIRIW